MKKAKEMDEWVERHFEGLASQIAFPDPTI